MFTKRTHLATSSGVASFKHVDSASGTKFAGSGAGLYVLAQAAGKSNEEGWCLDLIFTLPGDAPIAGQSRSNRDRTNSNRIAAVFVSLFAVLPQLAFLHSYRELEVT